MLPPNFHISIFPGVDVLIMLCIFGCLYLLVGQQPFEVGIIVS